MQLDDEPTDQKIPIVTSDPMLITALTALIETTLNTALRYDPASRQRLATMNEVLAIESTLPSITLYLQGTSEGIAVMGHYEGPVTTQLTGSPLALTGLLQQPKSLANSGVTLVGSTGLLQQWQQLLQQLDIDWEEPLSQLLGDVAGPLVAQQLRTSGRWAKGQAQVQQRLLSEYLPYELGVVVSREEMAHFIQDIDQIKLDADRLGARTQRLLTQLATLTSSH